MCVCMLTQISLCFLLCLCLIYIVAKKEKVILSVHCACVTGGGDAVDDDNKSYAP